MATIHQQEGLYTPDDMLWRVNRELLLLLSGSRAVLLEIAHPLIAEGVARHSSFRQQPLKRLLRTVRTMQQLSFGDAAAARRAAKHVHHAHRPVAGQLQQQVGPLPAGAAYDANATDLQLWVFATVVDSILLVYDRFVRPLTEADKAAYYEDSKRMAHMLGIVPRDMPATYPDFAAYVQTMLHSDELTVGATGRDVADALFHQPLIGPFVRLGSFVGIGLLPPHLREAFGLTWSARNERWLERLAVLSRWLRPKLPDVLCIHPQAAIGAWQHHWHKRAEQSAS